MCGAGKDAKIADHSVDIDSGCWRTWHRLVLVAASTYRVFGFRIVSGVRLSCAAEPKTTRYSGYNRLALFHLPLQLNII